MTQQHADDVHEQLGRQIAPHLKFAIDALREGGLNQNREEIRGSCIKCFPFPALLTPEPPLGYELLRAKGELGYELGLYLGPVLLEDEEKDPNYHMVNIQLMLPGTIPARVLISRRTDEKCWTATVTGTLSLPVGHPLGELAHADRFIGLGRERTTRVFGDQRDVERCLMEIARIFERETR